MKGLCGDENDDNNEDEGEHSTRIFFYWWQNFPASITDLKVKNLTITPIQYGINSWDINF